MKLFTAHNTYVCMRHAKSTANEMRIIISHPDNGISQYGITEEGRTQISMALAHYKELRMINHIYSSDFLRAYQTALMVAHHNGGLPVTTDGRLRERYFGIFEGTSSDNYHKVWDMDCTHNNDAACYEAEPISSVARRMLSFIKECELNHSEKTILVVSHGDPLQILFAVSQELSPNAFTSVPHFTNSEVRILPHQFFVQKELMS